MKFILQGVNNKRDDTTFSDMTGYKTVTTNLYSISRNFLEVMNLNYYMPNELDAAAISDLKASGKEVTYLSTGDIDPVQFLFNDEAL